MLYIALGCAVLALLAWASKRRPILKRREWRLVSGALAVAAFAGAAYVGIRGEWGRGLVLMVLGLWLASTVRMVPPRAPRTPSAREIGEAEARSILGVGPGATNEEIQAAYSRLMRLAHPDKGGTDGLAAQLNAARDRLFRK